MVPDVPRVLADPGDLPATGLGSADLAPLGAVLSGDVSVNTGDTNTVVVESVGSAVLDAAAAAFVYERARETGVGTDLSL